MRSLPRVALGAVHTHIDHRPVLWGLLHQLESSGIQTQCFLSQSRFAATDGVAAISGRSYRHLDPQLMTQAVCRDVMLHGARCADLAIVEDGGSGPSDSLAKLCRWLDMPRLMVVEAGQCDPCRLPHRPENVDGIFLAGAANHQVFAEQRLRWETLWGVPVFGGLVGCAHICAILQRLPTGSRPSAELVKALGENLFLTDDIGALLSLSHKPDWVSTSSTIFQRSVAMQGLNVAVAFDDAFHAYFSDTLDLLELGGARLRDFSPLADPELPANTDVVFLGCGHVDRFADTLSANPCMIAALRRHARNGGRIYAEGGAAAYLCNHIEFDNGQSAQMCGILPAAARYRAAAREPELVDLALSKKCWLGNHGDRLRGYRNPHWSMRPMGPLWSIATNPAAHCDLLCRDNVIASQVHLNLVAQPHLLAGFATSPATAAIR